MVRQSALFDEAKAADVAAYFLIRARDERDEAVTRLKLMKLMYLAERLNYERFGFPMTGDRLVSMPHGPVLSRSLELMTLQSDADDSAWTRQLDAGTNNAVTLKAQQVGIDDLRELSESDVDVLDAIWGEFGAWSASRLRNYTHDPLHCPEWRDPDGSSHPISLARLMKSLGYSTHDTKLVEHALQAQADINSAFAGR